MNIIFCLEFFRHQIQHYTQQLVKDTNVHLRDLATLASNSGSSSPGEQRQRKMQKERLQDEFTSALNNFQVIYILVTISRFLFKHSYLVTDLFVKLLILR